MIELLVKNFHWLIILYAVNNLYMMYDEREGNVENLMGQTPVLRAKITKEKRKIKQIEEFKKNLTETKARVTEVVDQIKLIQKQLPSDVNDAQVQSSLSNIANELKIKDIQQSPQEEANNGFYFAKNYEFKASGTFLQALIFFENLEKSERILNVKSFRINSSPDSKRSRFPIINFSIIVESFRYNNNYRERDAVKDIEKQFN